MLARLQSLRQLADVTSDQQANAAAATLTNDRDRAARFGIEPALIDATISDAISQRQVAQYFTQLNSYHVVMEVDPALQGDARPFDRSASRSGAGGADYYYSSRVNPIIYTLFYM